MIVVIDTNVVISMFKMGHPDRPMARRPYPYR